MHDHRSGWGLAATTILLVFFSNAVSADSALNARISKYKTICSDYEKAKRYVECYRPPGSYQAAYQMTGERRKRALEQGRKAMNMSRDTDRHMDNRYRRR